MLYNLRINKILWSITTFLVLIVASFGIINPHIYDEVFAKEFIPGALPQDILSIFVCFLTFSLVLRAKEKDYKLQAVIIGIIGSFFYLYGIFTIERVYNSLYLLYAAIFALSTWSLLYSLMSLNQESIRTVKITPAIALLSAGAAVFIAVLFTFLWVSALLPLMREHRRIEYLYSIYILDLCFIMPAFIITSFLTLRKKPLGIIFLPPVFIIGFFVIFPLGLGEMAKPYYGQSANYQSMTMSFVFSVIMLALGLLQLRNIKK